MREIPMLFNGEMVRAILEGRKTQTRRPVKNGNIYRSPFGQPGDSLWVRETFRIVGWHEGAPYLIEYRADGKCIYEPGDSSIYDEEKYIQYAIDCANECANAGMELDEDDLYVFDDSENPIKWRPSIHMPRWASRLTLEVKRVWVERLSDMDHKDFLAEGMMGQGWKVSDNTTPIIYPSQEFEKTWNKIYGKKYPASLNPWMWCCEFEVIK